MLAVIGGGAAGTYHARQLLKAVRRASGRGFGAAGLGAGLAGQRIVVVDRDAGCRAARELAGAQEVSLVVADWLEFLRAWLPTAGPEDHVVPAPLAPHLLWQWLAGELDAVPAEPPRGWGLPYERPGPGGELYLSAAAWTCPATCVEPAHCPALHAPRDWDLAAAIEERTRALGLAPAVFRCVHLANGVGSVGVGELAAARRRLAGTAGAVVATSSRCHAAVGRLAPARTGYTLRLAEGA
jgi:hypothetical protein